MRITPFSTDPRPELDPFEAEMHRDYGIMKTIYVPVTPYVRDVKLAIARTMEDAVTMYDDPHSRIQDGMHQ